MSRSRVAALVAVMLGHLGGPAWATDTWTTPWPGIKRLHRKTSSQNINVLVVDLCAAGVSLRATASSERKRKTSNWAWLVGAQAAINGDFFSYSNYSTNGLAMSGGAVWPGTADHSYVAPVAVGDHKIAIPHHNNITAVQSWMKEVVSGHPTLLDDGKVVGNPGDPLCTNRHPRTVIGVTQDHKKLILAVVDGRASNRLGMTCDELATLLLEFNAYDGVNMDGGGSSTMYVKGTGVVNYPSDGSERVVANHLGVHATGSGAAATCPCTPTCKGTKIVAADCSEGDCAAYGAYCSTLGGTPHCVSAFCVKNPNDTPKEHDVCLPDGKLAHCTKEGGLEDAKACPEGTTCVSSGGSASCVTPPDGGLPDTGVDEDGPGWAVVQDGGVEGFTLRMSKFDPAGGGLNALEGGCACALARPRLGAGALALLGVLLLVVRRRR